MEVKDLKIIIDRIRITFGCDRVARMANGPAVDVNNGVGNNSTLCKTCQKWIQYNNWIQYNTIQ